MTAYNERSLADGPEHGDRRFFDGSLDSPKGYWATYDANRKEWVRSN